MEIIQNIMQCVSLIILSLVGIAILIDIVCIFTKSIERKKKINNMCEAYIKEEIANYDSMTVAELKKIAQSKKIPGYYKMKRNELISTLKQNQ